jgi:hypothetical protein
MKLVIVIFLLLTVTINADEIQRIESIVNDITELRSSYKEAQNEIVDYKLKIKNLEKKNENQKETLKIYSNYSEKEKKYTSEIKSLKNELKRVTTLLKTKEKSQKPCKLQRVYPLKNKTIVAENRFPTLLLKDKYQVKKLKEKKEEQLTYFKAKAFKLNKYAFIYDGINGEVVESWEEKRSFTSNVKSENWVKITGYFINKVWQPAKKELWVKKEDTLVKVLESE